MARHPKEIKIAGIRLQKKGSISLHQQLCNQLRGMILRRQLRSNERVPSGRDLAKDLSISRIVVTIAYEQLIMEGYLVGKPGVGTFVSNIIPDKLLNPNGLKFAKSKNTSVERSTFENHDGITPGSRIESTPFQIGLPSLDSFPHKIWHQCANSVLKNFKSIHLGYEDTLGYWPLRKAVAAYLRISRAVKCEAEQVIIVTGSQQGLNLIASVLLNQKSNIWMEDPGYFGFKSALKNIGAAPNPVPITKTGLDINFGHSHFGPADLAYVTPSFQFPLGYTLGYENRKKLLDYAKRHSMWIIEDDYDSEFRYSGNPLSSLQGMDEYGKVIYSGTFSKVLFPGLRVAYLVIPDLRLLTAFREVKETIDRQSPVMEQAILSKFMEDGHFLRHIRRMRLLYAQRQDYLIEHLNNFCKPYLKYKETPAGMHLRCAANKNINIDKLKSCIQQTNLKLSFIDDFAIGNFYPGEFLLGYTGFTKYQLKQATEKLANCLESSV